MIWSLVLIGLINGTLLGLVFALMASGFNLSIGVARVINFQHGANVLWAMYAAYLLWNEWGISPLISVVPITVFWYVLGYILQKYLVSFSLRAPEDNQILFAIGLLTALQFFAQYVFSDDAYVVRDEHISGALIMGNQVIQWTILTSALLSLAVLIGLHVLFVRTALGRNLRACAQNTTGASLSGLDVDHLYATAMGLSAACAAVSGVSMALFVSIVPDRAFEYTLLSVVISVLGGLGNMVGSILGGLVVGIVLTICQVLGYGAFAQAAVYSLVFLIFLVRPSGLLGARTA
jgi:branched-chain amino acid transport system permease protein